MADNREDSDELKRVSQQVAGHLSARGIKLNGRESADELTRIADAVERFEQAVESRGGDLMVDEAPRGHTTQPDDAHFALPLRNDGERVAAYVERLDDATDVVRKHLSKD